MGDGYYFWDSNINCAIEWGKRSKHGHFRVFKGTIERTDRLFDLQGSGEHYEEFMKAFRYLKANLKRSPVVHEVILFMRKYGPLQERYDGIRLFNVEGMRGIWDAEGLTMPIIGTQMVDQGKGVKVNLGWQVQICLFSKEALGLSPMVHVLSKP